MLGKIIFLPVFYCSIVYRIERTKIENFKSVILASRGSQAIYFFALFCIGDVGKNKILAGVLCSIVYRIERTKIENFKSVILASRGSQEEPGFRRMPIIRAREF